MTPFGSRVLVTGGSRGIGLAYAEALAGAGCDIVLNHFRDDEKAARECARLQALTGRRVFALDADVGASGSARAVVDRAVELLDGLDVAISNAGICEFTPFLDLTDESWARHLAVNFSAGFYIGQQAALHMVRAGKGGRIVFTSSVGAFRNNSTQTHYCATKGGIHLLMLGMALELGCHGITVNSIAPGWIHTDINDASSRDEAAVQSWIRAHCPAGRLGRPDDLKAAILFLCSREAAYVTGTSVGVDGGWNAQL